MTAPVVSFTLLKSTTAPRGAFSRSDLAALARFTLARQKVAGAAEITLDITGHKRIQELNRRFRGVDRTTDVISFLNDEAPHPGRLGRPPSPRGEGIFLLSPLPGERSRGARVRGLSGDLAINVQQAALQAQKMGHPLRREVRLLLIHGILHLLGYTDYTPGPRRRMFQRQNAILLSWERKAR